MFFEDIESSHSAISDSCINDEIPFLTGGAICDNEVASILKQLKLRKACGPDKVQNEHLIHGGSAVVKCLTFLFNIITKAKNPKQWKRGLIVPIYKGGDKLRTSPDSYRPVCLLSCVLKTFEKIMLSRLQSLVLTPNQLQQGFQRGLGCLTASFIVHETIYHNVE